MQISWLPDNGLNKLNSELNGKVIRQTPVMLKLLMPRRLQFCEMTMPKHNSPKMDFNFNRDNFAVDEKYDVVYFLTTYEIFDTVIKPTTEIVTINLLDDEQTNYITGPLGTTFGNVHEPLGKSLNNV